MLTAVIPARGGSKRIPRKNLVEVSGKPLIVWTIEAVRAAGIFERILVSTDCVEIAKVAEASGAWVPGLRPAEISGDHATMDLVLRHAIQAYNVTGDWVALIYATACLLRPKTLSGAVRLADAAPDDVNFVMGVQAYPHPIQRAVSMRDGEVRLVSAEHAMTRTQDLEEHYYDAGQFVLGRNEAWLSGRTVWDGKTVGVPISHQEAIDIDTPDDLALAKILMEARRSLVTNA